MSKLEFFKIIPETANWTQLQLQWLWSQFQVTPETAKIVTQVFSSRKIREKLTRLHENPAVQQTAEALILTELSRLFIQRLF